MQTIPKILIHSEYTLTLNFMVSPYSWFQQKYYNFKPFFAKSSIHPSNREKYGDMEKSQLTEFSFATGTDLSFDARRHIGHCVLDI